jgi:hypothetical protein
MKMKFENDKQMRELDRKSAMEEAKLKEEMKQADPYNKARLEKIQADIAVKNREAMMPFVRKGLNDTGQVGEFQIMPDGSQRFIAAARQPGSGTGGGGGDGSIADIRVSDKQYVEQASTQEDAILRGRQVGLNESDSIYLFNTGGKPPTATQYHATEDVLQDASGNARSAPKIPGVEEDSAILRKAREFADWVNLGGSKAPVPEDPAHRAAVAKAVQDRIAFDKAAKTRDAFLEGKPIPRKKTTAQPTPAAAPQGSIKAKLQAALADPDITEEERAQIQARLAAL